VAQISKWPLYIELDDIILVHAGLDPGKKILSEMSSKILMNIRTWDGKGNDIESEHNPPWYDFMSPEKIIIFGHWARKGLTNLPKFKGLDTGCVYGKLLTGYCPEEDRFYSIKSRKAYEPIEHSNEEVINGN
jgi:bis(5'-nucleosyl)-tetraphosphatase (symmetrical)